MRFYRRFLRSLVRQVRYLRHTAIEARDGVPRLQALVALDLRGALHGRAGAAHAQRDHSSSSPTSSTGRSCPTAATSAAIPAR